MLLSPLPLTSPADIARLRASAVAAQGRAATARDLAADIDRRRHVVRARDDEAVARHTPEVWTSRAATRSRGELRSVIGLSLWLVDEDLRATRIALEARAAELESTAHALRLQANRAEDELARIETSTVETSTVERSGPVDMSWINDLS